MDEMTRELVEASAKVGLTRCSRHIFLCADQSDPQCCAREAGIAAWEYLKKRLKELGLSGATGSVYRSKANCLRVCCHGPVAVVYRKEFGITPARPLCSSRLFKSTWSRGASSGSMPCGEPAPERSRSRRSLGVRSHLNLRFHGAWVGRHSLQRAL